MKSTRILSYIIFASIVLLNLVKPSFAVNECYKFKLSISVAGNIEDKEKLNNFKSSVVIESTRKQDLNPFYTELNKPRTLKTLTSKSTTIKNNTTIDRDNIFSFVASRDIYFFLNTGDNNSIFYEKNVKILTVNFNENYFYPTKYIGIFNLEDIANKIKENKNNSFFVVESKSNQILEYGNPFYKNSVDKKEFKLVTTSDNIRDSYWVSSFLQFQGIGPDGICKKLIF
ncbi:MAG: hypothetical protein QE271_12835 [Bacteriovoracaceae bacterium]|nr:hypothetical protein [Bacteriovoracaceae bacterium]